MAESSRNVDFRIPHQKISTRGHFRVELIILIFSAFCPTPLGQTDRLFDWSRNVDFRIPRRNVATRGHFRVDLRILSFFWFLPHPLEQTDRLVESSRNVDFRIPHPKISTTGHFRVELIILIVFWFSPHPLTLLTLEPFKIFDDVTSPPPSSPGGRDFIYFDVSANGMRGKNCAGRFECPSSFR